MSAGVPSVEARPLLTIEEAAQRLSISVSTVYRLVESNALTYVDVSTRVSSGRPRGAQARPTIRFREEDLAGFIAARLVPAEHQGLSTDDVAVHDESGRQRRGRPIRTISSLPGADRYAR